MAATVSSPWAKSWALDSEQNEEELKPQPKLQPTKPETEFPSLATAATTKPKKKNKAQPISLAEFNTYSAPKPVSTEPKGLTQDELLMLPTGPRERTGEENDRNRLGGGFRNYGGGERGGDRERSRVSERREGNRERVDLGPSRADEVDDWSKTKKFGSSFGPERSGLGPDRRERTGGFFNSNRADEVDNWAANKSVGSFNEAAPRRERRMGFDSYSNGAGAGAGSDSDNWLKKKTNDVDSWGKRESNGPNGRPKLNLQPRTLPVVSEGGEGKVEGKGKGGNPFGEARPREEVLKEKGKDWKEIDEKLEAVKMKEVSGGGEKSEGFGGRRRGFGAGLGDEKSVKTWRKPEANDVVPSPTGSSAETAENNVNTAESSAESAESAEEVPEEN